MKLFRLGVVLGLVLSAGVASSAPVGAGEPGALGVVVTLGVEEPVRLVPRLGLGLIPVRLTMPEGVHTYWLNPGEAGLPTRIAVKLPDGWGDDQEPRDVVMPPPSTFESGGVVGFGYEGEVEVVAEMGLREGLRVGADGVAVITVTYLACDEDRCVPGKAVFPVRLQIVDRVSPADEVRDRIRHQYVFGDGLLGALAIADDAGEDSWKIELPLVPDDAEEVNFFSGPEDLRSSDFDSAGVHTPAGIYRFTDLAVPERDDDGGWHVVVGIKQISEIEGAESTFVTSLARGMVAWSKNGRRFAWPFLALRLEPVLEPVP